MASDALWVVSFKCVVKGYQECRFDVKEGEEFKGLKKIGKNNFTVAFTIYPFHHDSDLFPDVQYAEACTPFAL